MARRDTSYAVKWLDPDTLVVNEKYQRHINAKHVARINEAFDAHCVVPIRVLLTDAGFEIVDGQHTWEVLKLQGWKSVPTIQLNGGATEKEAAEYFGILNTGRKGLRPIEMFRAAFAADNPRAIEITRICKKFGLVVSGSKGPRNVAAVKAIEEIYEEGGETALSTVFHVATSAWDEDDNFRLDRRILLGLHVWLASEEDAEKTIVRLQRTPPATILRKAQFEMGYNTGTGIGSIVAREIGRAYRKRRRGAEAAE